MARVTVEDCRTKVVNHFELIGIAALRAKELSCGAVATVKENNKIVVTALREIAAGNLNIDEIKEKMIYSFQNNTKVDLIEDENLHAETQDAEDVYDVSDDDAETYMSDVQDINISSEDIDFSEEELSSDELDIDER